METFLLSTWVVALAEVGDKTQLLSLMLAARYRRPWPIVAGILAATLVNHAVAAWFGASLTNWIGPEMLRWILGASFIAMAAWMLIPDKLDEDDVVKTPRFGVFGTTLIAFFIAEIGDKTQIATVALAAREAALFAVVMGTTLGMMIANAPVVWMGEKLMRKLPVKLVHGIAAAIFAALGVAVIYTGIV